MKIVCNFSTFAIKNFFFSIFFVDFPKLKNIWYGKAHVRLNFVKKLINVPPRLLDAVEQAL